MNFQVKAIKSMITPYNKAPASAAATDECVARLTERHFLEHTLSAKGPQKLLHHPTKSHLLSETYSERSDIYLFWVSFASCTTL